MIIKKYVLYIISIIIINLSLFIIPEGNKGLCFRFGKIIKTKNDIIYNPGLYFKVPFIDKVKIFNSKIQTLEIKNKKFINLEKRNLIINYYIKWKINDFKSYYFHLKSNRKKIEILIKKIFNNKLDYEIKKLNFKNIIKNDNFTEKFLFYLKENKNILNNYGINIIDFKITKIFLAKEDLKKIYKKMEDKNNEKFLNIISKAKNKSDKIKKFYKEEMNKILFKAKNKPFIIKKNIDIEMFKKDLDLFKHNYDLYLFIKKIKTYEKILKNNDLVILNLNK